MLTTIITQKAQTTETQIKVTAQEAIDVLAIISPFCNPTQQDITHMINYLNNNPIAYAETMARVEDARIDQLVQAQDYQMQLATGMAY